jgi:ribonucleoside-triphosphate reductase
MQKVIKRDGREVAFDRAKVIAAIEKSFTSLNQTDDNHIAEKIADSLEAMDKTLNVEEIQNIIEAKLMASKHKDVAREYTNYRYLHKMARSQYNELMAAVANKLTAKNVENQNELRKIYGIPESYLMKRMIVHAPTKNYNNS